MQLSKNFTLEEFLHSDRAVKEGIDNSLPEDKKALYIANAVNLAANVLQKIRDDIGLPMTIISGFRCEKLNEIVQGDDHSQHKICEAADITVPSAQMTNEELYDRIKMLVKGGLIVDQCICEKRETEWVHVSFSTHKTNRNEFLRGVRTGNVWHYVGDSIG